MKVFKIAIVAFILLLSAGVAFAENSTSQDVLNDCDTQTLETENDEILTVNDKTFSELDTDIKNSPDTFEVQDDYAFDNATDNPRGVLIARNNFTINGNGHTIDAKNRSAIFTITANVTINNLVLKNANSLGGSVFNIGPGSILTTNNLTLIDNSAELGVVLVYGGLISSADKILNSTSGNYGVIIIMESGAARFTDAFMMSSRPLQQGFIFSLGNSYIEIANSTFANTTSRYNAAVHGSKFTRIRNSRFVNLHANLTAGAITVKNLEYCLIDNCTFINVTSEKNAGAVFADGHTDYNLTINNSRFIDCHSQFGGAILQLGGMLIVENTNFTDNSAFFDGGAIYTSHAHVVLNLSKFTGNILEYPGTDRQTFGGTVFCDKSSLTIVECEITGSYAACGGAAYLYDSIYQIENNTFSNNRNAQGDYDDIYSEFDGEYQILRGNIYSGNDTLSMNNERYETIMNATGIKIVPIVNSIDVESIPLRFDLRDWNWSTDVRDQGQMGSCWAFGTSGALEGAILRYLGWDMDISENNMQDVSLQYYKYGTIGYFEGGSPFMGASYALSWLGVFSSEYDTYDELGKISPIIAPHDAIHFQDIVTIEPRTSPTDNDGLKQALMKYGALAVFYHSEQVLPYTNMNTGAQYVYDNLTPNHGVTLIGWDDTYSRHNFPTEAPGDGAWIIKNSWGKNIGDGGYFYISYYDVTFVTEYPAIGFLLENDVQYNKNYQYDIGGELRFLSDSTIYANIFQAVEDDLIAAVGTYFSAAGINYTVEIYINDEFALNFTGISPYSGYHTIKLDKYIPIKVGDIFGVSIESDSVPILRNSRQHFVEGTSMYLIDGEWVNASDSNVTCCLKVYTVPDDAKVTDNSDISADYGDETLFTVRIVTGDGHAIGAGETVTFTINGKTSNAITDDDGIASIGIAELPGTYVITTECRGKAYDNNVSVRLNTATCRIVENKNINVDYDSGKYFTVKVVAADGKLAVSGASVKITVNGKTSTVKSDKNGIAKVKITAAPGKYTVSTVFNGITYKNKLTVRHVLNAKKATVKKTSKKLVLKATLKINSQAKKGQTIKFKVNGKTYRAKTNSKGIAKVTLKKNVIKKLKKGKSYTVKVTYLKDTVKTTLKVR